MTKMKGVLSNLFLHNYDKSATEFLKCVSMFSWMIKAKLLKYSKT